MATTDACARVLRTALSFLGLEPREPELRRLHRCFDNWRGVGDVVAGMTRQGWDLQLHGVRRRVLACDVLLARVEVVDLLDERANPEDLVDVIGEIELTARRLEPLERDEPNHSGISRRDLGAPKFSRDFVAVPRNSPAPSPVAL